MPSAHSIALRPALRAHYAAALRTLTDERVEFLVGGGFSLFLYLRKWRFTKDLDLFVRARDVPRALDCLSETGFATHLLDPTWLAKARRGGALIDVIFCSYNGLFPVDESWFDTRHRGTLFGIPVRLVSPEEMVLSKSFVAARDRFDGADVAWLIRELGHELDWGRIESAMLDHWQVLLWQLVHTLYVFPSALGVIPPALLERLVDRFTRELASPSSIRERCQGPMLDPISYQSALGVGAASDPRHRPRLVTTDDRDQVTSSLTSPASDWIAPATSSGDEKQSSTSPTK